MGDRSFVNYLNGLVKRGNGRGGVFCPVTFYSGDALPTVKRTLSSICPYGKIVLALYESTYFKFGKKLSDYLTGAGFKVVLIVFAENVKDTSKAIAPLFSLSDDVRAVVTFDGTLNNKISYYASVKDIDHVVIPTDLATEKLLSSHSMLLTGETVDFIRNTARTHVVIDYSSVHRRTAEEAFALAISRITALYDYRINLALNGQQGDKEDYNVAKDTVKGIFASAQEYGATGDIKKFHRAIFEANVKLNLANYLSGGRLFFDSGERKAAKLYFQGDLKREIKEEYGIRMLASLKLTGLYSKYLFEKEGGFFVPDYDARAEFVSAKTVYPRKQIKEWFEKQIKVIDGRDKNADEVLNNVANEAGKTFKCAEYIKSIYYSLGGVKLSDGEDARLNISVKHCGDFPYTLGGAAVLRESGALESLK